MSSWELKKKWKHLGRWNRSFLVVLWLWMLLIVSGPLMIPEGEASDLSGSVGTYDNKDVIDQMNPIARVVYYLGDMNCHQLSHRSYSYNEPLKDQLILPIAHNDNKFHTQQIV